VDLEVRDPDPLAVEPADDIGELLGAVVEAHRKRARRRRGRRPEPPEHRGHPVAIGLLGRRRLDRRAADLGLERVRGALGDELADVDDPDPIGERVGLLEVLGRQEHGHAVVVGEARDLVPERGPALDVEPGGRLVEEQKSWLVDEREREVEPALHPARVAADLAVGRLGEPDAGDQAVAAALALVAGQPVHPGLEAHVLARRQERVERRLLEGDADRIADGGALLDDVVAGDPRRAGGRREEGGQHVDGGRLAGAVRAEEAVDLTGSDREIDPVDGARALLELANQALDLDPVVAAVCQSSCRHCF
jgi:hypothetical protein